MTKDNSSIIRVAVVVLNWNGIDDTLSCLSSINIMDTSVDFDIIVVDNASTEQSTLDKLTTFKESAGRNIVILRNNANLGFAGGVNTGISHALSDPYSHIALINNDAVVNTHWLSSLVDAFSVDEKIGVVTGSLMRMDRSTIDSTGEEYSIWGLPFPRFRNNPADQLPTSGYVFGATGGATLYKRAVFESVGLFDETFFAYYEDVDISFRAQLQGWKVYYENTALAYHKQGASSSKIPGFATKQTLKNLPLLYIKNVPSGLLFPVGVRFWLAYKLIAIKAIFSPNFKPALSGLLQGVWLFWTHGLQQRFKIQKKNRVSSQDVRKMLWPDLPPDQTGLRKLFRRPVQ